MQRRLSEIAEIPKILSSTLATVSQTFDKLIPSAFEQQQQKQQQQHNSDVVDSMSNLSKQSFRKYSYDEDALDYELSDDNNEEEEESDDDVATDKSEVDEDYVEVADELSAELRRLNMKLLERANKLKHMKIKDITPESDYASDTNYVGNESDAPDDEPDNDNDTTDDDEEEEKSEYVQNYFYQIGDATNKTCYNEGKHNRSANVTEDDDDDEDFLTTTYTWNMRNIPKLQLNDDSNTESNEEYNDEDADGDGNDKAKNINTKIAYDNDCYNNKQKVKRQASPVVAAAAAASTRAMSLTESDDSLKHEKHMKLDKFERSWPWADREKIIYKQSTCHLVRRKPLGLIEKRIEMLAKQNLMDNLQKADKMK